MGDGAPFVHARCRCDAARLLGWPRASLRCKRASAQPIASLGDAKAAYAPRSSDFATVFSSVQYGPRSDAAHARAAVEDCETRSCTD